MADTFMLSSSDELLSISAACVTFSELSDFSTFPQYLALLLSAYHIPSSNLAVFFLVLFFSPRRCCAFLLESRLTTCLFLFFYQSSPWKNWTTLGLEEMDL
jgi:hypothetical protein